jgi:hypothetical protein
VCVCRLVEEAAVLNSKRLSKLFIYTTKLKALFIKASQNIANILITLVIIYLKCLTLLKYILAVAPITFAV